MADVSGSSPLTSILFVCFSSFPPSFGREGFFFIKKIFYENEKERLSQSKNKWIEDIRIKEKLRQTGSVFSRQPNYGKKEIVGLFFSRENKKFFFFIFLSLAFFFISLKIGLKGFVVLVLSILLFQPQQIGATPLPPVAGITAQLNLIQTPETLTDRLTVDVSIPLSHGIFLNRICSTTLPRPTILWGLFVDDHWRLRFDWSIHRDLPLNNRNIRNKRRVIASLVDDNAANSLFDMNKQLNVITWVENRQKWVIITTLLPIIYRNFLSGTESFILLPRLLNILSNNLPA